MEIEKLHSQFLKTLSKNEVFYPFAMFILLISILINQNKIDVSKIHNIKMVYQMFMIYFSYFKPKYGILLILLYVTYSIKKYKILNDYKVKTLQDKLKKTKKEKAPSNKVEKFVETSSCSVCK